MEGEINRFLIASLIIAITPGPGVVFIVTRSAALGVRSGLASVLGIAIGNFANALGASLGLAVLFRTAPTAFGAVKLLGAAYLIYLGITSLAAKKAIAADSTTLSSPSLKQVFKDGVWVSLLNPKTTIFFAAFLPQFVQPEGSAAAQCVMLGAIFVVIASITDALYAITAGVLAPIFQRTAGVGSISRCLSAFVFIGLGIMTALSTLQ